MRVEKKREKIEKEINSIRLELEKLNKIKQQYSNLQIFTNF
jgi:uncharacterized protein involved in exopolysaccharide biosynthesis